MEVAFKILFNMVHNCLFSKRRWAYYNIKFNDYAISMHYSISSQFTRCFVFQK